MGAVSGWPGSASARKIELKNETDIAIVEMYSGQKGGTWSADLLGDEILVPGQSVMVELDTGEGTQGCGFDVKTVFDNGTVAIRRNVNFCNVDKYIFGLHLRGEQNTLKHEDSQNTKSHERSELRPNDVGSKPADSLPSGNLSGNEKTELSDQQKSQDLQKQGLTSNEEMLVLDRVEQALGNLLLANVRFNVPKHIPMGRTRTIQAKVSAIMNENTFTERIPPADRDEAQTLRVSHRMYATLNGGGGFDVSPIGRQLQYLSKKDETSWLWEVTPKQIGTQELTLVFEVYISIDGKDGTRTVRTLTPTIEVDTPWPENFTEWLKFIKETGENMGWLWATVFVPLGMFAVNRFRKYILTNKNNNKNKA
jgi:hypothetical protein